MTGYAIQFEGRAFTPDGRVELTAEQVTAHNADLEAAELESWSKQPDRFAVYIVKQTDPNTRALNSAEWKAESWYIATTWNGTRLSVGRVQVSKVRHNMSRNMVAVRFRGTNGADYFGRYGADWSQLCRVRKAKG